MANPIKWLGAAMVLALLCPAVAGAQTGKWDRNRPRRDQVKRQGNQSKNLQPGGKKPLLTREQAKQLHPQENQAGKPIPQAKQPAPAAP